MRTIQQNVNDSLNGLFDRRAKTPHERAELLLRVAEWLTGAFYVGPCDRSAHSTVKSSGASANRCFDLRKNEQPSATWGEYDPSQMCDSCALYWHASLAQHIARAKTHEAIDAHRAEKT